VDKPRRIRVKRAARLVRYRASCAAPVAVRGGRAVATALVIGSLVACTANRPKIVVDENGPQYPNGLGSFAIFEQHYQNLYKLQISENPDAAKIRASAITLVKEGTGLAYQLCGSFFKTAGTEQQYLLFARDLIGVAGTLATGILGATHASPGAIGAVGIGSGAALSGISIYARNFLFSEDNVQAVQNLTLTAMSAASAGALQRTDYDFFTAVQAIMDVQSVCEVQSILSLVRQSINQAQPQAVILDNRISVKVPPQQPIPISRTSAALCLRGLLNTGSEATRAANEAAIRKEMTALGVPQMSVTRFVFTGQAAQQEQVARNLGCNSQH
jgi:hypothetical protein